MYSKKTLQLVAAVAVMLPVSVMAQTAPKLGKEVSNDDIASISTTIFPDGEGLPKGKGTVRLGRTLYEEQCATCHLESGAGEMQKGVPGLAGKPKYGVDWTTGSAWPYATSIFDYVRRAMPPHGPKELTTDEVYSLTAYILHLNDLVPVAKMLDQHTLPKVKMPSVDTFGSKWERVESNIKH
jgi:cytochrome c